MLSFLKNNILGAILTILILPSIVLAATLIVPQGGTGVASCVVGGLLRGNGTSPFTCLTPGDTGEVLTIVGGVPQWAESTGGTIGTSTTPTGGHLSYWTSENALGSVATGSLTTNATGLELSATRGLVGGSAILSLSSGYAIPTTTDFTNWNTAFGWGNHASAGYLSTTTGDWTGTFDGQQGTYYLDRANHTGTQAASTISDFDTEVSNNTDVASNTAARHDAVTLSGALDYITLVGQDIVRGAIDVATDISGFASGIATWLGTPSSANLRSALTDEVGTGPAVFASSTVLTSPTLTSFFGTPCTGNNFLQDIGDTGTFSCAEAAAGSGTLSLFATTTGETYLIDHLSKLTIGTTSSSSLSQINPDGSILLQNPVNNRLTFSKDPNYAGMYFQNSSISDAATNTALSLVAPAGTSDAIQFNFEGTYPQIYSEVGEIGLGEGFVSSRNSGGVHIEYDGSFPFIQFSSSTATNGTRIYGSVSAKQIYLEAFDASSTENFVFDLSVSNTLNLLSGTGVNLITWPSGTFRTGTFQSSSVGTASSPSFGFSADTNTGMYKTTSGNANSISFSADGAAMATINTTGVGISTTTPESKLDVWGASSGKILTLFSDTGTKFMEMLNTGVTTLLGTWNFNGATVKQHTYKSFTWPGTATTTAATSTVPLGTAFTAEAWNSADCWIYPSGTGAVIFTDGTNRMNGFTSTTTVARNTLSTNNTFSVSEQRYVEIGPLTAAQLSCSVDVTVNN